MTSDITIKLHNQKLWESFHEQTTEMIVTKTGRKMFPKLEYSIVGMDPNLQYGLVLQIEQVDENRYKFNSGQWQSAGRGDIQSGMVCVPHHDGVMKGSQWMKQIIHFERVKITNNPTEKNRSHVFLHSMHKYIPVLSVYQLTQSEGPFMISSNNQLVAQLRLACTEFIAVTAYQNEKIKELKIEHNPFAKGFRDGGERKRPSSSEECLTPPTKRPSLGSPITPYTIAGITGNPHQLVSSPMIPISPLWYSYWNPYLFNPLLSASYLPSNKSSP